MKQAIALCDANAFYCSCERVFNPGLAHVPLAVLSNNDGCIVARTHEVKAMGIKMGTPAFKVRQWVDEGKLTLYSSNYTLYGCMSSRFMSVLEQFSPRVEVYSIDESFVDLTGQPLDSLEQTGFEMKQRVRQWTGLPIGVGISTTKTLAKLANYAAKHYPATGGVVDLMDKDRQQRLMAITPVEEVWGIGRKISQRLQHYGVKTALDLVKQNQRWIRKQFSVVLERTVCELQGELCIPWEETTTGNKHQIVVSRSFGHRVSSKEELHSALASFISRGCEKLRAQNKVCKEGIIFIRTDPFKDSPQYHQSYRLALATPGSDTRLWLAQLAQGIDAIYREGYDYKKAGFILVEVSDPEHYQQDLLTPNILDSRLMNTVDQVNRRFGRNTLKPASTELGNKRWFMNQNALSPSYTTCWQDIVRGYCR